jgi:hypothetical protein
MLAKAPGLPVKTEGSKPIHLQQQQPLQYASVLKQELAMGKMVSASPAMAGLMAPPAAIPKMEEKPAPQMAMAPAAALLPGQVGSGAHSLVLNDHRFISPQAVVVSSAAVVAAEPAPGVMAAPQLKRPLNEADAAPEGEDSKRIRVKEEQAPAH